MRPVCVLVFMILLAVPGAGAWASAQPVASEDLLAGAEHQYQGELDLAEQEFSRVLESDPDNEFVLNQLGLIHAKRGDVSKARSFFSRAAEVSADNVFARLWLGILFLETNDRDQAAAMFREVLALDPYNAGACYFLGVLCAVENDLSGAIEWFEKAQNAGSDDPDIHYRLAVAFSGLDMEYNAQLEFERTLALHPGHTKALNGLGWIFYDRGERNMALRCWNKALELNSSDAETRAALALVHNQEAQDALAQGEVRLARELWEQTLAYEPDNKAAKHYLRTIN